MSQQVDYQAANLKMQSILEEAVDVVCQSCNGRFFKQSLILKKASKLLTGTAEDMLIPIPVYRCDDCGEINDELKPKSLKKND